MVIDRTKPLIEIILDYRFENGLTQKQLAKNIGISEPNFCRIEKGKQVPTEMTKRKILKYIEEN